MRFTWLLGIGLLAAVFTSSCENVPRRVQERFVPPPAPSLTYPTPLKEVAEAGARALRALGFQSLRGGSAQRFYEATSPVGGGGLPGNATQLRVRLDFRELSGEGPEAVATEVLVSVYQVEEDARNDRSAPLRSEVPVRNSTLPAALFAEIASQLDRP